MWTSGFSYLSVSLQVEMLHSRTGTEVLVIAVRSDLRQHLRPHVFYTSDLFTEYFDLTIGKTANDIAFGLEGYCISGIRGYGLFLTFDNISKF
jgi:hypothetical protein